MSDTKRLTILFLQGHPSRFWSALGDGLDAAGHRVLKINFSLGDRVFWRRKGAVDYRGRMGNWGAWLTDFIRTNGVTDIYYYADRLPYHAEALEISRSLGVRCWAIEFGYLRPDWLTFEPEAMGARSLFPKTREGIAERAERHVLPDLRPRYHHTFSEEAFGEVTFALLSEVGRPAYPFYRSDRYYWPGFDYLAWLVVLAGELRAKRRAGEVEARLMRDNAPYNMVAMQLQQDYQIRASSPYDHLEEFLEEIVSSFAQNAPADRRLLFKMHPLDNGLENWPRRLKRLEKRYGIVGRTDLIRGGDLGNLIRSSQGVIYVNSTVGLHCIMNRKPSIAMGSAVFDIDGLTHQGGIDSFWRDPEPVDGPFLELFLRALMDIQVRGTFYGEEGREAAIAEIVRRMDALAESGETGYGLPPLPLAH
jgi:capsular polysaccharide export protein